MFQFVIVFYLIQLFEASFGQNNYKISVIDHKFKNRDVSRDVTSRFVNLEFAPPKERRRREHLIDEAPNPVPVPNNSLMGQTDFGPIQRII